VVLWNPVDLGFADFDLDRDDAISRLKMGIEDLASDQRDARDRPDQTVPAMGRVAFFTSIFLGLRAKLL